MDEMSEKLGAILNNPQMMQFILSMAQTLGQQEPSRSEPVSAPQPATPSLDPGMLQTIGSLAGSGTIDREQQALLKALSPYLSAERVRKLENAMRAAKMARMASLFLNSGGMQLLTGR